MSRITITTLQAMKSSGEKITCLTAYDSSFAALLDDAGIEILLVGDSLGMVVQGQDTTLPVTLDEMIYHTRCVARGSRRALLMADMPFMADADPQQALLNAGRLMKEGGAQMVKLEGGAMQLETVHRLAGHGIPVCAHLGLLPQSVHKLEATRYRGAMQKQPARFAMMPWRCRRPGPICCCWNVFPPCLVQRSAVVCRFQ